MKNGKFEASDFRHLCETEVAAAAIAVTATALLAAEREKMPVVYCRLDGEYWAADCHPHFARATLRARLCCIEEIGK